MSRKIQVIKMRGQRQLAGMHGFRINRGGIEVFPRVIPVIAPDDKHAPPGPPPPRLSTGIPVLDEMMGGGVPAGYALMVSGPTGSGKTVRPNSWPPVRAAAKRA